MPQMRLLSAPEVKPGVDKYPLLAGALTLKTLTYTGQFCGHM